MAANSLLQFKQSHILLLARVMMASLYIVAGVEKICRFNDVAYFAASFHVPMAKLLLPLAIALELGASLGLLTARYCRASAALLAVWTFVLGIWFHPFWITPADQWQQVFDGFFHHFVMTGGLMYVMVVGARVEQAPSPSSP